MDNPSITGQKASTFQSFFMKTSDAWLKNKRFTDGAEGLWRVHDNLYDVTDYIKKHPGGRFWLEETRGTDITEAFESHHVVSLIPEKLLKKFFVRKAKTPRASPYTFKDDGFYRTVKMRVREALKTIPKDDKRISDIYTDGLLAITFILAIFASKFWSYTAAAASGISLGMLSVAAHNYVHQRDNFRMYYSDICMLQVRGLRVIHILSHHFCPNTITDAQIYFPEPMVVCFPKKKSFLVKYVSWIYAPLFVWPTAFQFATAITILGWVFNEDSPKPKKSDLLPFLLPLTMWLLGGQFLLATLGMWQAIVMVGSFCFGINGAAGSHVHPDIFIDGDTPRPKEEMDWGINQLDTISDRVEVTGSKFWVLVTFGDHALHHLFPTLDHSILHHLYPVVQEVMKQFSIDIRMTTQADMFTGYFRQLARDKGNPNPPNLLKGRS